jgi:hypothetical protein
MRRALLLIFILISVASAWRIAGVNGLMALLPVCVIAFACWINHQLDRQLVRELKNRSPEHLESVLRSYSSRARSRVIRQIDREHGLCEHCGYDLRHNTARCPECGQPIPADLRRRAD